MKTNSSRFLPMIFLFLLLILGEAGCSSKATAFEPQTVAGVYLDVGYDYYRWDGGPEIMIWHDAIQDSECQNSMNERKFTLMCRASLGDTDSLKWKLVTQNEQVVQIEFNDIQYQLTDGNVFLISSSDSKTEVQQLTRDLSQVNADAESVTEFGLNDPEIFQFIQTIDEGLK